MEDMRQLPLLFLFLLLSGCMVGPKYQEPEISLPGKFEEIDGFGEVAEDLSEWWKRFNDPLLDGFIAEALRGNFDLRLAVERIEQARAQYRVEKSHLWPEIDLNATAVRSRLSQNLLPAQDSLSGGPGLFSSLLNIFQVGFDAIWELDFFGKFRHAKRAAYYSWEAMREDAETVLISMTSEVVVTYINIRALQKKIELMKMRIGADERELAIMQALYEIGLDNELQVMTLISSIETDRAALPVLETSFKQSVYALAYLLGRQPEGLLDQFLEIGPIPSGSGKVPVGLPSDLLRRRPDVRSAERQLAAATEQVGAAVADLFPRIALTGISLGAANRPGSSIGLEGSELNDVFKAASRTFSVGANLNWNLIDFGGVRGKIDEKNSLQRQALLTYEQTVISSLKDVESALVAYFEEEKRRDSFLQKVEADARSLQITEDLYEIGIVNEIQVLNAQKNLLASESSFVESEQAFSGDLVALYKALGGSWTSVDLLRN
jgi:NodT family efflux transporter outer membrane factor (OMF) lipoprotein